MTVTAGNKADFELPGDLGEHDPRRMEHPLGNEPGSGGHEVKPNSAEVLGHSHNDEPTAANHSTTSNPGRDNTAEQAFEGGSTETMDRAKRQTGGGSLREGEAELTSRAGHQQQSTTEHHHGHHHHSETGALGGSGAGLTGREGYQSGIEPVSGRLGSGIAGEPYDAGNVQGSGLGGAAPQHTSHFGSHTTRAGELLDPASGKETGIPGYAGGSERQL